MSSNIYDQCKVRVGSCARTLLADAQTLRSVADTVAEGRGYREGYAKQADEEATRAYAAFELVQRAFDLLTGGKMPGMRGT